ncbi:jg24957, partial [Pararge aegeria aegeria]
RLLIMGLIRKPRITQQAMERAMLPVSLRDQFRSEEIRRRTRVTVVVQRVSSNLEPVNATLGDHYEVDG